jgi:hypothetical protein
LKSLHREKEFGKFFLAKKHIPIWTAVFAEGSTAETDWKKGSKALIS